GRLSAGRLSAAAGRLPAAAGRLSAAAGWLPAAAGWLSAAAGWLPAAAAAALTSACAGAARADRVLAAAVARRRQRDRPALPDEPAGAVDGRRHLSHGRRRRAEPLQDGPDRLAGLR